MHDLTIPQLLMAIVLAIVVLIGLTTSFTNKSQGIPEQTAERVLLEAEAERLADAMKK